MTTILRQSDGLHLLDKALEYIQQCERRIDELQRKRVQLDAMLNGLKSNQAMTENIQVSSYKIEENLSKPVVVPQTDELDRLFRKFKETALPDITCETIEELPDGALGYLFHNIMTREEIEAVIGQCQENIRLVRAGRIEYRNCDRVEVVSQVFADFLWHRLRSTNHPVFNQCVDDAPKRFVDQPNEPDLDGKWEPYGLNPLIRIIKYPFGGHFSPHYDGHYCFTKDDRTLLTCMMYLTDKFEGGATEFLSESVRVTNESLESSHPLLSPAVTCSVKPRAGTCIVFSHHLLHQGGVPLRPKNASSTVEDKDDDERFELKWILRSEVCFKRTWKPEQPLNVAKALGLLEEARVAENHAEFNRAMELYSKAFKLYPELNQMIK